MIPLYTRVVAIDDDDDHLQKIVWGLGKARFCALPFRFVDGQLENPPAQPLPGIRIVFTDIHLVGGGLFNERTHAASIINCLKQIVAPGPYVLVFWSQYPGDTNNIADLIRERATGAGLMPPIGHAAIDKNDVFKVAAPSGSEDFDPKRLRDLILERISGFKTLAVAASWEDRVSHAAARTTDRVFGLVRNAATPTDDWENLLAFLACEAVGQHEARQELIPALDAALLPLLEDQLSLIGREPAPAVQDVQNLLAIVSAEKRPACPASVTKSQLNASYLVE
ncbi:MAG: hypothetical protein KF778_22970, partial [Rhodocyclaceae bacterium]|nr:hypothetical protein [Rhodocyclaceae bacterium]